MPWSAASSSRPQRSARTRSSSFLTQFGDEIDPRYGGDPGPRHNEIAEPDRETDNSTIWQEDYNREHYVSLYGETDDDSYPSLANFLEEQSNGKYTVQAEVSDWVQLEFNEARYGSDHDQTEQYWAWVTDSVNAWWDQNCAGGGEDECNEVLSTYDVWDRYDYDGDGNYDEADGYLDHFQLIHAGEDESDGGGAQGTDAIWAHRWHVNLDDVGFFGPEVPGSGGELNLHGGAQIGDSPWWVGDYTAQPENGGVSVFAHEYMHDLELPDEYGTDGSDNDVNWWSLMGQSRFAQESEDRVIGDRANGLNAWDRAFVGWLTPDDGSLYIAQPGEQEIEIGPATPRSGNLAQAAVVNLPDRELSINTPNPPDGIASWWSFYGDNLDNTLLTTETIDLSGGSAAEVTALANFEIEEGFDYVYAEATTDDPSSETAVWTRLNGTVDGEPIWEEGEVEGLDGSSGGWVDLTYDLSEFAGQSGVSFRFDYVSDGGVAPIGFFFDTLSITSDGTVVFADDAESEGSGPWTADGFVKAGNTYKADYPQRYWVENRQLTGVDAGFDNSPYNFFNPFELPNQVEWFPNQTGPLIWYNWDAYGNNNTLAHPGVGQILPIDLHPELLMWQPDGTDLTSDVVRSRIQAYDATMSFDETDQISLGRPDRNEDGTYAGSVTWTDFGPNPGVTMFDDVAGVYWYEDSPAHGVILEPTGTQIELLSLNPLGEGQGESATMRIQAPEGIEPTSPPPTFTPTPTLPPTGGDNSSALAGIGLGALLAGGLLVALAARRLRQD